MPRLRGSNPRSGPHAYGGSNPFAPDLHESDPPLIARLRKHYDEGMTPGVGAAFLEIRQWLRAGLDVPFDTAADRVELHVNGWRPGVDGATLERTLMDRQTGHEPLVYYVRHDRLCKIGTTTNLDRRLSTLGIRDLLATEPGGVDVERTRHAQFKHLRAHGEWFNFRAELRDWVATRRAEAGRLKSA